MRVEWKSEENKPVSVCMQEVKWCIHEWISNLSTSWWHGPVCMLEKHPVCYHQKEELSKCWTRQWAFSSTKMISSMPHRIAVEWQSREDEQRTAISVDFSRDSTVNFRRIINCWQAVGSTGTKNYCSLKILYSLGAKAAVLWVLNTAKIVFWNTQYLSGWTFS